MSIPNKLESLLVCPFCQTLLQKQNSNLNCVSCGRSYLRKDLKIYFREFSQENRLFNSIESSRADNIILSLKAFAKKWPYFFWLLYKISAPFIGKTAEKFAGQFSSDDIVLNLGSGAKIINDRVVNVDYDAFPSVWIIADINKLPFKSNSIDAIICESVFEHLADPRIIIEEIFRILKPTGQLYVVTPFMLGYHSSPVDYYRWTEYGMKELLKDFHIKEIGMAWGPTTAVSSIGGAWLALIFSFGFKTLYQIWLVFFLFFFAPLNRLDHLLKYHPRSVDNAHGLYFVAIKK